MPIYEYECRGCGDVHEFIQKFSDSPKRKCPSCGRPRLRKLISAAAFHLKGDGWYVTDFRDKGKGKDTVKSDSADGAGGSKADSKSTDSTTSDAKSDTKTGSSGSESASKSTSSSEGSSRAA